MKIIRNNKITDYSSDKETHDSNQFYVWFRTNFNHTRKNPVNTKLSLTGSLFFVFVTG